MPRPSIPLATPDLSTFAKLLRSQLVGRAAPPGHLELLNMLARAAGHRNFQALRARAALPAIATEPWPAYPAAADPPIAVRAAACFDREGRLMRWPGRTSLQHLCLWGLWARLPRGRSFDERAIGDALDRLHLFGDRAILRRTMCQRGLLARSAGGRDYRRIEQPPPLEAAALLRRLRAGQALQPPSIA